MQGWFQSNGSRADLQRLADFGPRIPLEHNPEPGVLAMRKRQKGDAEGLRQRNALAMAQAKTPAHRRALEDHWRHAAPVIGRVAPHAGPTTGGTRVFVYGTNFAGGSVYKCKFGHEIVTGAYDNSTGCIVCVSPPLGVNEDALYLPTADAATATTARDLYTQTDFWKPNAAASSASFAEKANFLDVKFSIAIFFHHENKTHHAASHDRKFHYYVPKLSEPNIFGVVPSMGPVAGGTIVTVFATHVAHWEHYFCQFGDTKVVALHQNAVSGATEYLLCTAPPALSIDGVGRRPSVVDLTVHIAGTSGSRGATNVTRSFVFEYYDIGFSASGGAGSQGSVEVRPRMLSRMRSTLISLSYTPVRLGRYNVSQQQQPPPPLQQNLRFPLVEAKCRFAGTRVARAVFDPVTNMFYCYAPPEVEFSLAFAGNDPSNFGDPFHEILGSEVPNVFVEVDHVQASDPEIEESSNAPSSIARAVPMLALPGIIGAAGTGRSTLLAPGATAAAAAAAAVSGIAVIRQANTSSYAFPNASRQLRDALVVLGNMYEHVNVALNGHLRTRGALPSLQSEQFATLRHISAKLRLLIQNVSIWEASSKTPSSNPKSRVLSTGGQLLLAPERAKLGSPTSADVVSANRSAESSQPTLLQLRIGPLCRALSELYQDLKELRDFPITVSSTTETTAATENTQGNVAETKPPADQSLGRYGGRLVLTLTQKLGCKVVHGTKDRHSIQPLFGGVLEARLLRQVVTFTLDHLRNLQDARAPDLDRQALVLRWRSDGPLLLPSDSICLFEHSVKIDSANDTLVNIVWNQTVAWQGLARISPVDFDSIAFTCASRAAPQASRLWLAGSSSALFVRHIELGWPGTFAVQYQRRQKSADKSACQWQDDPGPNDVLGQHIFSLSGRRCTAEDAGLRVIQQCQSKSATGVSGALHLHWENKKRRPVNGTDILCLWKNESSSFELGLPSLTGGVAVSRARGNLTLDLPSPLIHGNISAGDQLLLRLVNFRVYLPNINMCASISHRDTVWAEHQLIYCPSISAKIVCEVQSHKPRPHIDWDIPERLLLSSQLTMCVFHSTVSHPHRFVSGVQAPVSGLSQGSIGSGLGQILSGGLGPGLVVRLEQSFGTFDWRNTYRQCNPDASLGKWGPGTLWEEQVQPCIASMHVSLQLRLFATDLAHPYRLHWKLNAEARRASTPFDLICVWLTDADGLFLRYENAFVASEYATGIPLSPWQFPAAVSIVNNASRTLAPRLVARFEHRDSRAQGGCRFSSSHWGQIDISEILFLRSQLHSGHAPVSIAVEVSFNGQDFHGETGGGRVTYFDPWQWNLPSESSFNVSVSVAPSFSFKDGGTLIVVDGIPFAPLRRPTCLFNATATFGFVQRGRLIGAPSPISSMRYFLQPPRLICIAPALPVGPHQFSVLLDEVEIDTFVSTSSFGSHSQGPFFVHVSEPCQVSGVTPFVVSCGQKFTMLLNCSIPVHTPVEAVLGSGSSKSSVHCLAALPPSRDSPGSLQLLGHHGQSAVTCTVPDHVRFGWKSLALRIGGIALPAAGLGLLVIPEPKVFGAFPSRGGFSAPQRILTALVFFSSPLPAAGPVEGGTVVTVHGVNIGGGSGYRCRFGGKQVEATFFFEGGIPAMSHKSPKWLLGGSELDNYGQGGGGGRHGVIRCVAPPAEQMVASTVEFAVSLNSGADFVSCNSCISEFTYFASKPAVPASPPNFEPNFVSSLTGGSVEVSVVQSLFVTFLSAERGSSLGEGRMLQHIAETKCMFAPVLGSADIPPYVADGVFDAQRDTVQCICPPKSSFQTGNMSSNLRLEALTFSLHYVRSDGGLRRYADVGTIKYFEPSTAIPSLAVPHRLKSRTPQIRSGFVQVWPLSGPIAGGVPVLVVFESRVAAVLSVQCSFGDFLVDADMGADGTAKCVTPAFSAIAAQFNSSERPYVDAVRFLVYATIDKRRESFGEFNFVYVDEPVLISITPMFGPARGGAHVAIRLLNVSSQCRDIFVAFSSSADTSKLSFDDGAGRQAIGSVFTLGLIDTTNGMVMARTPALPSGAYSVAMSVDGGRSFHLVAGRFLVMHDSRLAVTQEELNQGTEPVTRLVYNPFSIRSDTRQEAIQAVVIHAPLLWSSPQQMHRSTAQNIKPYVWQLNVPYSDIHRLVSEPVMGERWNDSSLVPHYGLLVSMVEVTYSDRVPKVDSASMHVREDFRICDDNDGTGWTFQGLRRREEELLDPAAMVIDWQMLAPWEMSSAIAVWASSKPRVAVLLATDPIVSLWSVGEGPLSSGDGMSNEVAWTANGTFDSFGAALVVDVPNFPGRNVTRTEHSTLMFIAVSLNGGLSYSECYGSVCAFAFDDRFDKQFSVEHVIFRISPAALTLVNQTLAFNLVSRWFTDQRIAFDVAAALGIARDRVMVSKLDANTGVVQVDLLASRLPADPAPADLADTLRSQISDTTSPLYSGITTWATDPLFVVGGHLMFENGKMYRRGLCSQPDILTEHACLSHGTCRCTGIHTREKCLASKDAGNYPCSWTSFMAWNSSAKVRCVRLLVCPM